MERIIIIDDDDALRSGFLLVLRGLRNYEIINTYGTCEDAILNFRKDNPSLVLMDLDMPGMGGIRGIREIKNINPKTEVIVITSYVSSVDLLVQALTEGALGYITKNRNDFFIETINAIEEMKIGGAPLSLEMTRKLAESFRRNKNTPLSPRETVVLKALTEGKSYTEIAEELFISSATARAHIRNIYEKLNVKKKSEAIAHAIAEKLI